MTHKYVSTISLTLLFGLNPAFADSEATNRLLISKIDPDSKISLVDRNTVIERTTEEIPTKLRYTRSHEWVRDEGDGTFTVGITEHAQGILGDMVYLDLPDLGEKIDAGEACTLSESVKAASDIFAPISGEIVAINKELKDSPQLVNTDPFGAGWLFRVKASNESELDSLLDAAGYADHID